jgi:two-component system OmpR family sensor kinase
MALIPRPHASTRLRLTAWYAAVLVLVLLALGISVEALARSRLLSDVDDRLANTAEDIGSEIERNLARVPFQTEPVSFEEIVPLLGSFASRGLLIQITGPHGEVVRTSEYAPDTPIVADPSQGSDEPTFVSTSMNGDDMRAVRYPLLVTDEDGIRWYIGSVIVGERLLTMQQTLTSLRQILVGTSTLGLALAIAGGWLIAGRALRPVDRVTAAAASIAAGDGTSTSLSARLPVPQTNDELARLSSTFNAMLARLEASFRAQERFVADASHELRTPLTAIRGNVDVLMRQARTRRYVIDASELGTALDDIRRESDRMRRLLDDLLLLARSDSGSDRAHWALVRLEPVRLDEIAAQAVHSAEALTVAHDLQLEAPRPVEILGDADRLHQLTMILIDNAIRHTPAGGHIQVAVTETPQGSARLAVRDDGDGIAPEHLPHLFERFYRADGARGRSSGGTGLGLAIARAITHAHGGDITVTSSPGQGTMFVVNVPALNTSSGAGESRAQVPGDRSGSPAARETYLLVTKMSSPPSPPTSTTNAIGSSSPAIDSLRKPRP